MVVPVGSDDEKPFGEKVGEKVGEKLSENQMQIVEILRAEPYASATLLAKHLGISLRKTEENLKKLRERSIIQHVGSARGGHWEVLE